MLDPERIVLDEMMSVADVELVPQVRALLGAFLFTGDAVEKRVGVLTGGERSRLALAKLLLAADELPAARRADESPRPRPPRRSCSRRSRRTRARSSSSRTTATSSTSCRRGHRGRRRPRRPLSRQLRGLRARQGRRGRPHLRPAAEPAPGADAGRRGRIGLGLSGVRGAPWPPRMPCPRGRPDRPAGGPEWASPTCRWSGIGRNSMVSAARFNRRRSSVRATASSRVSRTASIPTSVWRLVAPMRELHDQAFLPLESRAPRPRVADRWIGRALRG